LFYNGQGGETPTTSNPYKRQVENLKYFKKKIVMMKEGGVGQQLPLPNGRETANWPPQGSVFQLTKEED
jgi:hypothetical protein